MHTWVPGKYAFPVVLVGCALWLSPQLQTKDDGTLEKLKRYLDIIRPALRNNKVSPDYPFSEQHQVAYAGRLQEQLERPRRPRHACPDPFGFYPRPVRPRVEPRKSERPAEKKIEKPAVLPAPQVKALCEDPTQVVLTCSAVLPAGHPVGVSLQLQHSEKPLAAWKLSDLQGKVVGNGTRYEVTFVDQHISAGSERIYRARLVEGIEEPIREHAWSARVKVSVPPRHQVRFVGLIGELGEPRLLTHSAAGPDYRAHVEVKVWLDKARTWGRQMLQVGVGQRVSGIARYRDPKSGRTRFARYETPYQLQWVRHAIVERWVEVKVVVRNATGQPVIDPELGGPKTRVEKVRKESRLKAARFRNLETGKPETCLIGRDFLAAPEVFTIQEPGAQP